MFVQCPTTHLNRYLYEITNNLQFYMYINRYMLAKSLVVNSIIMCCVVTSDRLTY